MFAESPVKACRSLISMQIFTKRRRHFTFKIGGNKARENVTLRRFWHSFLRCDRNWIEVVGISLLFIQVVEITEVWDNHWNR